MLIKMLVLLALVGLLVWAAIRLLMLNRQEKKFKKMYREPVVYGTKRVEKAYQSSEIVDELEEEFEDNDSILGLNTTTPSQEVLMDTPAPATKASPEKSAPMIAIHMMALKERAYIGYELLQALLAAGLRYGDHNIFHRHEHKNGQGLALFHLASVNAPGTFELTKMGAFSCPGLSFFMQLNSQRDNLQSFELMLDTANELLEGLGGELRDEHYKPLTMDKITEYRLRIRGFQESTRLPDFFDQMQQV